MSDFTCPYCEAELREPDENREPCVEHQTECDKCEKTFIYEVEWSPYYSTHKADHLNDDEETSHD